MNDLAKPKRLVCYYCLNETTLVPELLDFELCTHIIAGFAGIWPNNSIAISEDKRKVLSRFSQIANANKNTKAMISVGGAGDNSFGPMISNHTTRKMYLDFYFHSIVSKKYFLGLSEALWKF